MALKEVAEVVDGKGEVSGEQVACILRMMQEFVFSDPVCDLKLKLNEFT